MAEPLLRGLGQAALHDQFWFFRKYRRHAAPFRTAPHGPSARAAPSGWDRGPAATGQARQSRCVFSTRASEVGNPSADACPQLLTTFRYQGAVGRIDFDRAKLLGVGATTLQRFERRVGKAGLNLRMSGQST